MLHKHSSTWGNTQGKDCLVFLAPGSCCTSGRVKQQEETSLVSSDHRFLLQRGKFHGSNSPALLFPLICRGGRRFLSSSCEERKEILVMEKRGGEKRNWETLQEAQPMVLRVCGPFQSPWQTGFNRRECHFWGKRQLRAVLNSQLLRANVKTHLEVSLQGLQFVDSRS